MTGQKRAAGQFADGRRPAAQALQTLHPSVQKSRPLASATAGQWGRCLGPEDGGLRGVFFDPEDASDLSLRNVSPLPVSQMTAVSDNCDETSISVFLPVKVLGLYTHQNAMKKLGHVDGPKFCLEHSSQCLSLCRGPTRPPAQVRTHALTHAHTT
jgi:hypothetical protein